MLFLAVEVEIMHGITSSALAIDAITLRLIKL
jgi:hypothetical protein